MAVLKVRSRFIHAAVLNSGCSIESLDDEEPAKMELKEEQLLNRKFLDFIILICTVRRGGDSVSVACLEEGEP